MNIIKKLVPFIICISFFQILAAQNTGVDFEKQLLGTWNGIIKNKTSERALKIVFTKVTFINTGRTMLYGYSMVNDKNKTAFLGTVQLVDGFVDLTLTEKGNKKTNGVFEINTHITDLSNDNSLKELNGNWTQNNTKKVKTVIVNKR